MTRYVSIAISVSAAILFAVILSGQPVEAQTLAATPGEASPRVAGVPSITVGWGAGPMLIGRPPVFVQSGGGTVLMGTVQFFAARYLVLEGEWTREVSDRSFPYSYCCADLGFSEFGSRRRHRSTTTITGNVLFRAGRPRLIGFVGGGFGGYRSIDEEVYDVRCTPHSLHGCDDRPTREPGTAVTDGISLQAVGGIDVPLVRGLTAFGVIRAGTYSGLSTLAGARVTVRSRQAPQRPVQSVDPVAAAGKEVRLTAIDGARRKGRLVSFSNTEVVLRQKRNDLHIPIADVRQIETVSHHVRSGALLGLVGGLLISVADIKVHHYREDGLVLAPLFDGLLGVAAGLAVGTMLNAATAERHVIYSTSGRSVGLMPLLSPRRAGAALAVRW